MSATYVLTFSILFQFIAACLALRLIPVAGGRKAWILVSAAIFLMAVRRCLSLYWEWPRDLQDQMASPAEWVALLTSAFMLAGIAWIRPLFLSIRHSTEAMKESEEKYRTLFEESRDAIYLTDGRGKLIDVNRSTLGLFGYTRDEMIGLDARALYVDSTERARFKEELKSQGYARDHEMKLRRKDGTEMQCILTTTTRRADDGAVLGYQGIIRDVTRRKEMERSLREKNEVLNAVLAASSIGISLVRNRTFEWVNETMSSMLGYENGSLEGMNTLVLYQSAEEYTRVGQELYSGVGGTGVGRVDTRWVRQDGSIFNVLIQASFLDPKDPEKAHVVAAMDITELKQAGEALRESEERYRHFFEENLTGVYIATPGGRFLGCNPAFARIFGFASVEEAMASDINTLYPDPGIRTRFVELLRQKKKLDYYESELRRPDGKPVHVIENAIGKFDDEGGLVEIKAHLFDTTERKNLEEQLRQAQKMEAIGRLAGGVAHDFNNLLTAISGYTDLLLMKLGDESPLRRNALEIKKASERAASLTRQLLAFSRKQLLQPKVLDLNYVISEMEKMLRRLIGEDIHLHTLLDANIGHVKIDPGQLEQVVMNLAVNARDAMPRGGSLTIETSDVYLDESYTHRHVDVPPGPYVMLAVSDTGCGMDAETLDRVFEPFFTTKEKDKGTGLGLATVYGIIKQSDGHIWTYSEPERGTTFKIYLPRVEENISRTRCDVEYSESIGGTETVLLVEDDEMVRSITSESLRATGYTVLEAHHAEDAFRICQEYDGPIHLLLTDIVMPGMNGCLLAESLAAGRPDMKILFMSGYTDKGIVHNGILDSGTAFLQKPFRLESLARKIREVIGDACH